MASTYVGPQGVLVSAQAEMAVDVFCIEETMDSETTDGTPTTSAPPAWTLLDNDLHLQTLNSDYAPTGLLERIGDAPSHILDIGCFCGGSGRWLRRRFPDAQLIGIEMLAKAAEKASPHYDKIIPLAFEEIDFASEGLAAGTIDAVIAADVLEHMINPWAALQRLKPLMSAKGVLYISLPNVRNLNVVLGLAEGRWPYAGSGILDITHLRFFTRQQAVEMLEQTGWGVRKLSFNFDPDLLAALGGQELDAIHSLSVGKLQLNELTKMDVAELMTLQFHIEAVVAG